MTVHQPPFLCEERGHQFPHTSTILFPDPWVATSFAHKKLTAPLFALAYDAWIDHLGIELEEAPCQ